MTTTEVDAGAPSGRSGDIRSTSRPGTRTPSFTSSMCGPSTTATATAIGDFQGLIEKLDYLQGLGVTALWLLPFYPSPLRDDGYDISDYRQVHPSYGTLRDFRLFLREAHRRGMRVITELVLAHTSDEHPWFQRARLRQAGFESPRLLRLERHAGPLLGGAGHLQGLRILELVIRPGGRCLLLAPLLLAPAEPQLRQSGRAPGHVRRRRLLALHGRRRAAARCRALPLRPGGHHVREPARDLRLPPRSSGRTSTSASRTACCWPRPTSGPRTPWRYMGTGRHLPHGLPLPAHAAHVHGGPPGRPVPDGRHPGRDPGHPPRVPVGALPPQPRRAHARDGHRRGARLHVPRLRARPPGPGQRRHPPAAGPAAGQRPQAHRDDERAAVLHAGDADHLLRRRDRHGRQHLPRRPQRGAHADAVEQRPQRRLLRGQSAAALPAGHHRPRVPLAGGQRRGPAGEPELAAVVDEAAHRPAPALQGLRPRLARDPAARTTARSSPSSAATRTSASWCVVNLSRHVQCAELDLSEFRGAVPVELFGNTGVPARRRPALLHHARAPRLLLVLARVRARRAPAGRPVLRGAGAVGRPLFEGAAAPAVRGVCCRRYLAERRWFAQKARTDHLGHSRRHAVPMPPSRPGAAGRRPWRRS